MNGGACMTACSRSPDRTGGRALGGGGLVRRLYASGCRHVRDRVVCSACTSAGSAAQRRAVAAAGAVQRQSLRNREYLPQLSRYASRQSTHRHPQLPYPFTVPCRGSPGDRPRWRRSACCRRFLSASPIRQSLIGVDSPRPVTTPRGWRETPTGSGHGRSAPGTALHGSRCTSTHRRPLLDQRVAASRRAPATWACRRVQQPARGGLQQGDVPRRG